jgi:hypothetical protein
MFRIVLWDVLPCKIIVDDYFTRQYIPEDNSEHHTRRRENLKSHKVRTVRKKVRTIGNNSSISRAHHIMSRPGLGRTRGSQGVPRRRKGRTIYWPPYSLKGKKAWIVASVLHTHLCLLVLWRSDNFILFIFVSSKRLRAD